jgi:uncharacterized RDD family membrane protein YckC
MEPATKKQRLLAISLDCVFILASSFSAAYERFPDPVRFLALAVSLGIFAANIYFLTTRGQTLGKRIVGIRIVLADTLENGGFVVNVLKRGFLSGLPYLVLMFIHPVLAAIYIWADVLMIFRADRRCLHDLIAGTCVVEAEPAVVQ